MLAVLPFPDRSVNTSAFTRIVASPSLVGVKTAEYIVSETDVKLDNAPPINETSKSEKLEVDSDKVNVIFSAGSFDSEPDATIPESLLAAISIDGFTPSYIQMNLSLA